MDVDVTLEERYWSPDDGGQVWVAGYQPVDAEGRFIGRAALAERGLRTAGVAGAAAHHDDVLQGEDLAPGAPLTLRRDPGNPHDRQAIAVHAPAGGRLGFVPRDVAAELAPRLDAGEPWSAVLLRERRDSPRDPRTGVTMLLPPAAELPLRVRGGRAPPPGSQDHARDGCRHADSLQAAQPLAQQRERQRDRDDREQRPEHGHD